MLVATAWAQPLDLIIRNARIWTGDREAPWASSLGISVDTITRLDVPADATAARIVDAQGRLVVPGFTDSHVHLVTGGLRLNSVQLRSAKSRKEFVDRVARFAATQPPGAWITGGDWDHENWGENCLPATGLTRSHQGIRSGSRGWTGTWPWPTRPR